MEVVADIDITTEDHKTVLALLLRHLPGTIAWVYGSRMKWTSAPKSDLDLVVFASRDQRPQVGDLRKNSRRATCRSGSICSYGMTCRSHFGARSGNTESRLTNRPRSFPATIRRPSLHSSWH